MSQSKTPTSPDTPVQLGKRRNKKSKKKPSVSVDWPSTPTNPFRRKLNEPICTPSLFNKATGTADEDDWTIDQKSALFPATIDESQRRSPEFNEKRESDEKMALDEYWSNTKEIFPSPFLQKEGQSTPKMPSKKLSDFKLSRKLRNDISDSSSLQASMQCETVQVNQGTQTEITLPTNVDFDFSSLKPLEMPQELPKPMRIPLQKLRYSTPEPDSASESPASKIPKHSDMFYNEGRSLAAAFEAAKLNWSSDEEDAPAKWCRGDIGNDLAPQLESPGLSPIQSSLNIFEKLSIITPKTKPKKAAKRKRKKRTKTVQNNNQDENNFH